MLKLLSFLLVALALLSCSENKEPNQIPDVEVINEPKVDSSAYYDSININFKQTLKDFFEIKAQSKVFNGTYLYAENGYIICTGAHGFSNFNTKDSNNVFTRFQLASASKPITATAILKLVEKGQLQLNDSVHLVLPDFPYSGITIEMLLCHRGGLGRYTSFTEYIMKDSVGFLTNKGILDILKDTVPDIYYPPNKKFDYSNTGYAILASIVEHVSGQSFKSFVEKEIFKPLDMNGSFVLDPKSAIDSNVATGYVGQKHSNPGNAYLNGVKGDKGVYATVLDLLKFDQALYRDFLPDSLYLLSISPQNPMVESGKNYGFGWRLLHPNTDSTIIYHTGWWQGFRSYFIRFPQEKKTLIVLDNVKTGPFLGIKEVVGLISDSY